MCKVISFSVNKGGCSKSASVQNIATLLNSIYGKRVLVLDLDPSANLTFCSGIDPDYDGKTIFDVMNKECETSEAIVHQKYYSIIPSDNRLVASEQVFIKLGKEYLIKKALEQVKDDYDFCLIDTPPSTGLLTINALTCSDFCIMPMEASYLAMQGIGQLNDLINSVRDYCGSNIKILGILLIKFNDRFIIKRKVKNSLAKIADGLGTKLFYNSIRESTAVPEAQGNRMSLYEYAPSSKPCEDYMAFTSEMLKEVAKYE